MRHKRLPSLVTNWGYMPSAAIPLLALTLACGGGGGGGSTPTPPPTPTNHAPAFTSAAPTSAKEGHGYTYVIAATDADNDTITLTLAAQPTGATLDATSKTISWTPTSGQVGAPQAFDVLANDGKGGLTHQTWAVTPSANAGPVFSTTAPAAATEGIAYSYVLAATDADGDAVTITQVTLPTGATFDATSKTISWTPSPAQTGVAQAFDMLATDNKGGTSHQTWSVTPAAPPVVNVDPVFTSTVITAAKAGHPYSYVAAVTDANGDTVTLSATVLPAGATFDVTSQTISWIPSDAQAGVVQNFDLLASDGKGGTAHQTWSVTPAANAAPVFTSTAPATAKEGYAYSYVLTATDADGDAVTLSLVTKPVGATFDATSKTISWTPSNAQAGLPQAFDVLADDGKGGTEHQTWSVTPTANALPVFTSTASTVAKAGHPYSYVAVATDADGDTLTFTAPGLPVGATFDATSKTITWTPSDAQAGVVQNFDLLVEDGQGGTQHQTWSVTPAANALPVFTSTASTSAKEGHPYSYVVVTTEADGDTVTLTAPGLPAGATFDATSKTITWTPSNAQAGVVQNFDVLADDGQGGTQHQTWSVTPSANALPVFTSTASTSAKEGHPYSYVVVTTEADGDTVTLTAPGLPAGATFDATSKTITWTPSNAQAGVVQNFDVLADDGQGGTQHQTWSVTPSANALPVFTSTAATSAKAGHPYSYVAIATDADGDTLTFTAPGLPVGATFDATSKTISWTPSDAQAGVVQNFDLLASDGLGGTQHQTWSVTPAINALPVFTSTASTSAKAGHPYSYVAVATDADGDTLTFTAPGLPVGATFDATSKTISWTPSDALAGVVQNFDLLASDGLGGTQHQTWSVTPAINALPVFTSTASTSAKAGHPYSYVAVATDADGDTLTFTAPGLPVGATFDATSKTISWTPSDAQAGVVQNFDLLASDGLGGTQHQTWSVTPAVNALPVFTSTASSSAKEGHPYSYVVVTTEADGDTVTLTAPTLPTGATFNAGSKTISWTPSNAQAGVVQNFDVLADDGLGGTQHQTWSVTPTTNAAPVFTSTAPATAQEGHPYSYVVATTEADGDTVTLTAPGLPSGATFNSTTKTISWAPSNAQVGVLQNFDVLADDGNGGTTHQTWSLTPSANATPVFTSTAPTSATGGAAYTYTLAATDADAGDTITYQMTANPTGATLTGASLSWTPSTGQERLEASFTVTATDDGGAVATQTFTVTPSGTIRGTRFVNHTPLNGAGVVVLDPAQSPLAISALAPLAGGDFAAPVNGAFAGDGSYAVGTTVPGGYYWLNVGGDAYVWTDKSTVNLGEYQAGRSNVAVASDTTAAADTLVSFNLTGMANWSAGPPSDLMQYFDWNTRGSVNLSLVPGATPQPDNNTGNFAMTLDWGEPSFRGGLVDTAQNDHPLLVHASRQTVNALTVYVTKGVYEISPLVMTDGVPASVPAGAFNTNATTTPFYLNWNLSDFTDSLTAVSPVAAISDSQCFLAGAYDLPHTGLTFGANLTVDLVRYSGGTGTTNVNEGPISYVDLPSRLTPTTGVEVAFTRTFALGATTPVTHTYWVNAYNATLPTNTQPITPLVTPATALAINNALCAGNLTAPTPASIGLASHKLSWTAPATGVPQGYRVAIYELTAPGAATVEDFKAFLFTPTTSIQVPPGLLVAGHTYSIVVRAIVSPTWDPTTAPFGFIQTARYGYAEATSGIITIP